MQILCEIAFISRCSLEWNLEFDTVKCVFDLDISRRILIVIRMGNSLDFNTLSGSLRLETLLLLLYC